MMTSILVIAGFLCLLLAGWGVLLGLSNGMSDSIQANLDQTPLYGFVAGVVGFVIVVIIGIWRTFA